MSETVAAAPAPGPPAAGAKSSAAAIWSMVLGILSIVACLSILGGIPAIILGVVGLKKIGNTPDELKGKGMAIAGISAGAIGTLSAPVIVAIMLPAMMQAKDRAVQSLMITEMRAISTACQFYAIDNDSQFPPDLGKLFPGLPRRCWSTHLDRPENGRRTAPTFMWRAPTRIHLKLSPF